MAFSCISQFIHLHSSKKVLLSPLWQYCDSGTGTYFKQAHENNNRLGLYVDLQATVELLSDVPHVLIVARFSKHSLGGRSFPPQQQQYLLFHGQIQREEREVRSLVKESCVCGWVLAHKADANRCAAPAVAWFPVLIKKFTIVKVVSRCLFIINTQTKAQQPVFLNRMRPTECMKLT